MQVTMFQRLRALFRKAPTPELANPEAKTNQINALPLDSSIPPIPIRQSDFYFLPSHTSFALLRAGLSIEAEVLVRTNGPGSHIWFSIIITKLHGEFGRTSWQLVRALGFDDAGQTKYLAIEDILVLKDPKAFEDYRGIPEIARYLRLMAGGLNERDLVELEDFLQQRGQAIRERQWLNDAGGRGTRKIDPAIAARIRYKPNNVIAEVKIYAVVAYGGVPWIIVGKTRPEKGSRWREATFTLPGFYKPQQELIELIPDGSAEAVPDPQTWLQGVQKRRKRPSQAQSRKSASDPKSEN